MPVATCERTRIKPAPCHLPAPQPASAADWSQGTRAALSYQHSFHGLGRKTKEVWAACQGDSPTYTLCFKTGPIRTGERLFYLNLLLSNKDSTSREWHSMGYQVTGCDNYQTAGQLIYIPFNPSQLNKGPWTAHKQ